MADDPPKKDIGNTKFTEQKGGKWSEDLTAEAAGPFKLSKTADLKPSDYPTSTCESKELEGVLRLTRRLTVYDIGSYKIFKHRGEGEKTWKETVVTVDDGRSYGVMWMSTDDETHLHVLEPDISLAEWSLILAPLCPNVEHLTIHLYPILHLLPFPHMIMPMESVTTLCLKSLIVPETLEDILLAVSKSYPNAQIVDLQGDHLDLFPDYEPYIHETNPSSLRELKLRCGRLPEIDIRKLSERYSNIKVTVEHESQSSHEDFKQGMGMTFKPERKTSPYAPHSPTSSIGELEGATARVHIHKGQTETQSTDEEKKEEEEEEEEKEYCIAMKTPLHETDEPVGATAWVQVHEEQADTQNTDEEGKEEKEEDNIGMESLLHRAVPGEENVKPIKMECRERVGQDGRKLKLDSFGIELEIPPGAIDCEAPQDICLRVLTDIPNLGNTKEEMSVCFGVQCLAPDDLVLKLPVTYTIPHCAVITGIRYSSVEAVLYTGEGEYSPNAVVRERLVLLRAGIPSCTIGKDVLKLKMDHFSWFSITFRRIKDLFLGRKRMCCRPFKEKELARQNTPVILHAHLYDDIEGNSKLVERKEGEQHFVSNVDEQQFLIQEAEGNLSMTCYLVETVTGRPALIERKEGEQHFVSNVDEQQVLIQEAEGDLSMTCYEEEPVIGRPAVVSLERLMGGVRICEHFVLDLPKQQLSVFVRLKVRQNKKKKVDSVTRFDFPTPQRIETASLQEQVEPDGDGYYKQPLKQAKPSNKQLDPKKNYKMDALTKGHMFIFYMSENRKGSDVDVRNVKHVFNEIGYEMEIHSDLTAEQLKEELRKFVRSPRHKGMCSVVFVLMGHGNKKGTGIKCKLGDTDVVHTNFVVEQVSRMKSMIGKPKMVFLQCCRGKGKGKKVEIGQDATDKAIPAKSNVSTDDSTTDEGKGKKVETGQDATDKAITAKSDVSTDDSTTDEDTGTEEETDDDESDLSIPADSDVFTINATKHGNLAYRGRAKGSWFIHTLCKVLLENAHDTDLATMLEQVTGDVGEMGSKKKAQVLDVGKQGVSKKMYFLPKYSSKA